MGFVIFFSFIFFYILCLTDIGSWLELFGFQLHNVLPGFPKPELENLELTYELLQLQTKTQEWDPGKVCKNFTISIYPKKKQKGIQYHDMALTNTSLLIFELSWIFTEMSTINEEVEKSFHEEKIRELELLEKTRLTWDLMTCCGRQTGENKL